MLKALRSFTINRRILKSLSVIDQRLAEQNSYLKRLANHFAPVYDVEEADADLGVSHLNPREAVAVQDFVAKAQRSTGRIPSDEEIVKFLDEEGAGDPQWER
jgi:hypothetical protein